MYGQFQFQEKSEKFVGGEYCQMQLGMIIFINKSDIHYQLEVNSGPIIDEANEFEGGTCNVIHTRYRRRSLGEYR